jgi:hypothetical protein
MDPQVDEVLREAGRALQYALEELDRALPLVKEAKAHACILNVRAGMRTTQSRLRDVRLYLEHHPTLRERLVEQKDLPARPTDPVFDHTGFEHRRLLELVANHPKELPGESYPDDAPKLPYATLRLWHPETHGREVPDGWYIVLWPDSTGYMVITPRIPGQ